MSRTLRRKRETWKFKQVVGSFEQFIRPWCPGVESWEVSTSRKSGVSLDTMYAQRVAWFYGDTKSGKRNAPRWFRRMHGSKLVRSINKHELRKCDKQDEWDSHGPIYLKNNAGWFWF